MHTNGTTESKAFAKLGDIAPIPLVGKPPKVWPQALEMCRKAKGWTQKQMIAEALRGENVSLADIKAWELGRNSPTINQCQKLRAAMPSLFAYEDLLRLELRAAPRSTPKAPLAAVKPEGWTGPPVKSFGEALRWCRNGAGMTGTQLGLLVGCLQTAISRWERGAVLVPGSYYKLIEIFPALEFAPKPELSVRFQNTLRREGFMSAQEFQQENARAAAIVDAQAPRPPVAPKAPDKAATNQAGAAYGVLMADVISLKAELKKMEARHMNEQLAFQDKIKEAEEEAEQAHRRMYDEVNAMHGETTT